MPLIDSPRLRITKNTLRCGTAAFDPTSRLPELAALVDDNGDESIIHAMEARQLY